MLDICSSLPSLKASLLHVLCFPGEHQLVPGPQCPWAIACSSLQLPGRRWPHQPSHDPGHFGHESHEGRLTATASVRTWNFIKKTHETRNKCTLKLKFPDLPIHLDPRINWIVSSWTHPLHSFPSSTFYIIFWTKKIINVTKNITSWLEEIIEFHLFNSLFHSAFFPSCLPVLKMQQLKSPNHCSRSSRLWSASCQMDNRSWKRQVKLTFTTTYRELKKLPTYLPSQNK